MYCKFILPSILSLAIALTGVATAAAQPNVLLIAVDDLNDWIGCLGGHPQANTPHLDALAKRGVLFTNAHCQSPVCNPSRASLMTSLYPATSGIYFLNPDIATSPIASKATTMPTRFAEEGYRVSAAGKLFHNKENALYFDHYAGSFGGFGPRPEEKISQPHGHPLWDWGAYPDNNAKMPDHRIADWAVKQLKKPRGEKPFFMGVGFYRPHVPMYAPKEWFDLHPFDQIQLPAVEVNDLADLSDYALKITRLKHVAPTHEWRRESGEGLPAVQSYLASTSFVDACVGRVLAALDASPHKDNTIIVMFSDHGFHLGEKDRWAKRSLWEDGTRVPLMIVAPGVEGGRVCHKPVELIDLYPTLLSLTGMDADPNHEGQSLQPLLGDPEAEWSHCARTSFGPGNVAVRSERYRYIRYVDGSEEFYDHRNDPHEWNNLAQSLEYGTLKEEHRAHVPKTFADVLGSGSTGHHSYTASAQTSEPKVRISTIAANGMPKDIVPLNSLWNFGPGSLWTHKGWQYAAYWDDARQVSIARRKLPVGEWSVVSLPDYQRTSTGDRGKGGVRSRGFGDGHEKVAMGISPDGIIHLSFDHHLSTLRYRSSDLPIADNPEAHVWSADLFGPVKDHLGGPRITSVTYPAFFTDGTRFLFYMRLGGGSGNANSHLFGYKDGSWLVNSEEASQIIDRNWSGGNGTVNAYPFGLKIRNGRCHLAWCWRDTPDPRTCHDLCYAYSDDFGETWLNNDGKVIGIRGKKYITADSPGLVVWPIPAGTRYVNGGSMSVDDDGRVHVLVRGEKGKPTHFQRDPKNAKWIRDPSRALGKLFSLGSQKHLVISDASLYRFDLGDPERWSKLASTSPDLFQDCKAGHDPHRLGHDGWISLIGQQGKKITVVDFKIPPAD